MGREECQGVSNIFCVSLIERKKSYYFYKIIGFVLLFFSKVFYSKLNELNETYS